MKRALVLGGGGSRGSYHVGVWAGLRELGWQPDIVTGSSVGAIIGAAVATDMFDEARAIFTSLGDRQVVSLPQRFRNPKVVGDFILDVAKHGGMDVAPLERTLKELLDEDALRASGVDYGLVTVRRSDRRPVELTVGEIPRGELHDYVLASAAAFPVYRPRKLAGEQHIDGAFYNNIPIGLADDMGADEVIAVSLDSGKVQQYTGSLPVRFIKSRWPLGSTSRFIPKIERRNYELGYLDIMKSFRVYEGRDYAFEKGGIDAFLSENTNFVKICFENLNNFSRGAAQGEKVLCGHSEIHRGEKNALLALAETTGRVMKLSPERVWDFSEFCEDVMSVARSGRADGYLNEGRLLAVRGMARSLLERESGRLVEMASTALPREYVAACFIAALKKREEKK